VREKEVEGEGGVEGEEEVDKIPEVLLVY